MTNDKWQMTDATGARHWETSRRTRIRSRKGVACDAREQSKIRQLQRSRGQLLGLPWPIFGRRKQRNLSFAICHLSCGLKGRLAESHRHQNVQEWTGNLDYPGAHLIDEIQVHLVLDKISKGSHEEFRIECDREIFALVHDR
jgi:hypothetical protein